jgi:2-polyprenyl-6-methoxyphenol hydroxylase-like FAD-dependent oxidoreductase
MRTLIIGAGVAGLTLAALMRQRDAAPTVIERDDSLASQGYMLGLFPLGGRVLHGLGLHPKYMARSTTMRSYNIGTGHGELVREYSLDSINRRYGSIQGIGHDELVELLFEGVDTSRIRTGTTVASLNQRDNSVLVNFNDGSSEEFDLVVAADGLHSDTRSLVFGENDFAYRDTGWGGWVFWADSGTAAQDAYTEYWGAGRFLGLYPTKERLGVFVGGLTDEVRELGLAAVVRQLQTHFSHPIQPLEAVPDNPGDIFFWTFHDCRAKRWRNERVILLGDAAVGFLPTAGVGASMAMESAAALNDELSRTDAEYVEHALMLYEKRHRRRVERAQTSSRQMGKWMFVKSLPVAWLRNRLLHYYTVERLVKDIAKIMDEPI